MSHIKRIQEVRQIIKTLSKDASVCSHQVTKITSYYKGTNR